MGSPLARVDALLAFIAAASAGAAVAARDVRSTAQGGHAGPGIVPEVTKTHRAFYAHDYPSDHSPSAEKLHKDFDHPYPAVQDTDDYDRDFVRDENGDGGEWKAQQEYDTLRSKLDKLRADERKAFNRKRELERQLEDHMAKQKAINDQSKELDAERQQADNIAKEDLVKAEDNLKRIVNGDSHEGGRPHVGVTDQGEEVTDDVHKLEECKRQLMEVHKKLKQLQEERLQAQKDLKDANEREKHATSEEFQKQKAEAQMEDAINKEQAAHLAALKAYKKESEDMKAYVADLEKAEARLRKFRRKEDKDGGVSYKPKSGAMPKGLSSAMSFVLLAAMGAMA